MNYRPYLEQRTWKKGRIATRRSYDGVHWTPWKVA